MDDEAWEIYKRGTKKIRRKAVAATTSEKSKPGKTVKKKFTRLLLDAPSEPLPRPAVRQTAPAVDDPDLLRRLQTGAMRLEAKLDLHHMTEDEAYAAVNRFIFRALEQRWRYLLIVTGRGAVLRDALPRWLHSGSIQGKLRLLHAAGSKHGGAGAFYVVLRSGKSRGTTDS